MSITPIADQVYEEHRRLIDLGFTPQQATWLIVAHVTESVNLSKQIVPAPTEPAIVKLIDRSGDEWVPQHAGAWVLVYGDGTKSVVPRTRSHIDTHYGPLKEVFA